MIRLKYSQIGQLNRQLACQTIPSGIAIDKVLSQVRIYQIGHSLHIAQCLLGSLVLCALKSLVQQNCACTYNICAIKGSKIEFFSTVHRPVFIENLTAF